MPLGTGFSATATFTPAAAAYSANDVMSVAQQFTGGPISGGEVIITSVSLQVAETALQASEAAYTLHLYNVTPPSAHADNAAWDLPSGDRAAYLGSINLGTPVDIGSSLRIDTDGINRQLSVLGSVGGGVLWGELVTAAGFTATATARKVVLHGIVV